MQTNATQIASSIATLLFEGVTLTHTIGLKLRELLDSVKQDLETAGKLIGSEWNQFGCDRKPISLLCKAAWEADLSKDEARLLMKSAALVSKQRISQVLSVVYDNDKSKNKGSKDRKAKTETAKAESAKEIIAMLKALPKLTKEEAIEIANIIKAKLA
jgi:hypothetical protein